MEVVVLLVAIVGVTLLVIPRLRRRKAGARTVRRASTPVVAAAAVPASSAASWAPPASDEDVWEDDLGWEGGEAEAEPDAREAWEEWRSTELTGAPEATPEPEVRKLPSVERWRARADSSDDAEWVDEDDDGLGWEGEASPSSAPAGLWNGGSSDTGGDWSSNGHDWSRGNPQPAVTPESAPAFARASAATDLAAPAAASDSDPELGRTAAVDEAAEWGSPITRTWGAAASKPAAAAAGVAAPGPASRPRSTRSRVHPVLLVAVYAAIGIGLVVLVSTVLLGGSSSSEKPASTPQPVRETATPAATAAATVSATPTPQATPDPAIAAAARSDFRRERVKAEREHKAALAAAITAHKRAVAAHKRAVAARKRKQQQRTAPPATTQGSPTPTYTPPANNTYTPPSNSGSSTPKPKPRPACEFCIG